MGLISEFKQFAIKGSAMDMAVGIIIGAAFGKIVSSLVSDLIMPPIGLLMGGVSFSDKKVVLKDAVAATATTPEVPAVALNYGVTIDVILNFLIVAIAVFMLVKAINSMRRRDEAASSAPPAPTRDQELLMEIRDALKARRA